ncbi:ABC transporter ATP-binding protein [Nonomuraea muscovyensis]|jgi:oligopeptide/dipeptide ABC transporter ATP-binding protein|uniref:Oligopeptide/dipeptide ABC transporter ATP-binding protein n=1 Tax=Nonomuraea muscovyensis TaxID=1124761 RepID=A0A7X0C7P5_9ACTN|nr:ABC transporter ATP-binding protein [Nonomuraea muscovyensis]MBB6350083.1 oligopeptide/dipeptide ABC transporter ATP-binding protein [Nonomuraea muscovyensis]MDF2707994.1 oligopeptide/dipeptide transporter, ATPase subunit [Nonomuraea muscovyensis]
MMLLSVEGLTIDAGGRRPILHDVSLAVGAGEIVGLVGESGSGKSTIARSVLRLLPQRARASGRVLVEGDDVLTMSARQLRGLRASRVAMIYQDPRSSLNPVRRIGDFLTERLVHTLGRPKGAARATALELLTAVGLRDPELRLRQYPHELSGGMLQRVVIAAALAAGPSLLLADEATSALDVTTQAETLALLRRVQAERGLGMLFITHDLHLAAAFCDRVHVLYAGTVVESRPAKELFADPRHPYTAGLLACTPQLGDPRPIRPIPGRPPSLDDAFTGCPFTPRCPHATDPCADRRPEPLPVDGGTAACHLLEV